MLPLILAAAITAAGPDYYLINPTSSGNRVDYIDASRIVRKPNNIRTAWVDLVFSRLFEIDNGGTAYAKQLDSFDCANRRMMITTSIEYSVMGSVVRDNQHDTAWREVVPDTIGEEEFAFVCEGKRDPAHRFHLRPDDTLVHVGRMTLDALKAPSTVSPPDH